jgi:hypothetical protein
VWLNLALTSSQDLPCLSLANLPNNPCYTYPMTELLEKTLATVQKLPSTEQDAIAALILEALEDEALLKAMQETDRDELYNKEQALAALSEM